MLLAHFYRKTRYAALGLLACYLCALPAYAETYEMRILSKGVRSALRTPTLGALALPAVLDNAAPFTLSPPTSESNGIFSYSSSNSSVATVSGEVVTVIGPGTVVITATQAAQGGYKSASTSATLTVSAAPLPEGYLARNNLIWAPMVLQAKPWSVAQTYCAGVINGKSGWRMPSKDELLAVRASGWPQAWGIWNVWSSTPYPNTPHYYVVHAGGVDYDAVTQSWSYTCVHP
jgi:hypothetical protein